MNNDFTGSLRRLLNQIVDYPDKLQVTEDRKGQNSLLLIVRPHDTDMGKIIGSDGKTIRAVQTVFREYGRRHGQKLSITVLEPDTKSSRRHEVDLPRDDWGPEDDAALEDVLVWICCLVLPAQPRVFLQSSDATISEFVVEGTLENETEAAINTIFRAIGKYRRREVSLNGRIKDESGTPGALPVSGHKRHGAGKTIPR